MSILGSLLGTIVDIGTLPVDVIKDVATMGGVLTDKQEPYTAKKLKDLADDIDDMNRDVRKL